MGMNKRALAMMWPIVVIVLGLVFMIALMLFYRKAADVTGSSADTQACRTSILANSRFGTEINCPTEFIKVNSKKPDVAKKVVADAMVRCWDNYGKGRLKLFAAEDTKFCAICSTVEFRKIDDKIEGFGYFLATKRFRRGKDLINYDEYLSGYRTSEEVIAEMAKHRSEDFLEGDKEYVILFTYYKDSDWTKIGAVAVGVFVGVVAVGTIVLTGGVAAPFWVVGAGAVLAGAAGGYAASEAHEAAGSAIGADWSANIIITHLNPEALKKLGCEKLPVGLTGLDSAKQSTVEAEVDKR